MPETLAALLAGTVQVDSVPAEDIPELIGAAAALQARLLARIARPSAPVTDIANRREVDPDELLTAVQAAARLGVAVRWMYRHAGELPFARRLSSGTVRFSARGLERWSATRRLAA